MYPKCFEMLDIRVQWGLFACWPMLLGYMVFLPLAMGNMGMNPVDASLLYLNTYYTVLNPILALGAGAWLLFAYLCSLAVPPALAIEQGRVLALEGYHAFAMLLVGFVLSLLPVYIPFFARCHKRFLPNSDLFHRLASWEPALPTISGWSSGSNPPLVYE